MMNTKDNIVAVQSPWQPAGERERLGRGKGEEKRGTERRGRGKRKKKWRRSGGG